MNEQEFAAWKKRLESATKKWVAAFSKKGMIERYFEDMTKLMGLDNRARVSARRFLNEHCKPEPEKEKETAEKLLDLLASWINDEWEKKQK